MNSNSNPKKVLDIGYKTVVLVLALDSVYIWIRRDRTKKKKQDRSPCDDDGLKDDDHHLASYGANKCLVEIFFFFFSAGHCQSWM